MWHAIYTKTKKEDSVAFRLQNIGVEVLNPRLKSRKFKNNRLIEVIEPLFPCYFFARFDTDKDGKVSKDEFAGSIGEHFTRLDQNSDGFIDDTEAPKGPPRRHRAE